MSFEPMSGADAAWLRMDREKNLMVVNTILHFAERPRWGEVERVIRDRVVARFRRFRQRARTPPVTFGLLSPWWELDDAFDLRNHLEHTDLSDREGSGVLDDYLASKIPVNLDRSRPLWHAELVDLPAGAAALLVRTHHALADGAAIVKVLGAATDLIGPPSPDASPARRPAPPPPRAVPVEAASLVKLGQRFFRGAEVGTPLTAPLTGAKRTARLGPLDLGRLKTIGGPTSSTVNDVFLGAIAGALRSHLVGLGVAPRDLDVVMPVNVRDEAREESDALGNCFGLVFVRLPSAAADPTERRRWVTLRTRAIKSSSEAEVVFAALSAAGHVSPAVMRPWVDAFINDAVAVVTNVAGPRYPVSLGGTPIASMSVLVPGTGPLGLGVSLLSYAGQGVISVVADEGTLEDPASFVRLLEEELRPEARSAAQPRGRVLG